MRVRNVLCDADQKRLQFVRGLAQLKQETKLQRLWQLHVRGPRIDMTRRDARDTATSTWSGRDTQAKIVSATIFRTVKTLRENTLTFTRLNRLSAFNQVI